MFSVSQLPISLLKFASLNYFYYGGHNYWVCKISLNLIVLKEK